MSATTNTCSDCNLIPKGCAECDSAPPEPIQVVLKIQPRRQRVNRVNTVCPACGKKTKGGSDYLSKLRATGPARIRQLATFFVCGWGGKQIRPSFFA